MKIPFTSTHFIEVFKKYNEAIFPIQFIFYLVIIAIVAFLFSNRANASRVISYCLSFFWFWMGIVYHIFFFSDINKAAFFFGALFIIQGMLFLQFSTTLSFQFTPKAYGFTGLFFLFYAVLAYPSIGYAIDHVYPNAPTFGLPCPTTIFTFGMLLLTERKVPMAVLIIPVLWSIVGTSAAINLGFYEDLGLPVAGIVSVAMILARNQKYD